MRFRALNFFIMSNVPQDVHVPAPQTLHVAIVASYLAPYRIPLFNHLNALPQLNLTALVCYPHTTNDNAPQPWSFPFRSFRSFDILYFDARGDKSRLVTSPGLLAHLARTRYDLVVTLGWTMPNTFLALLQRKLFRKPIVLWDDSIPHSPGPFKRRMLPLLKKYFGSFDSYLAASSWSVEYFVSMGAPRERVFLFPQVTDNDFFAARAASLRPRRAELKRALGIETAQVILYVGQFIPRKGVLELCEAFERVGAAIPDASLVLVGQGKLEAELRARRNASPLRDRIFICSFAPQQELPAFYALADVFVLPSFYDTFGMVVPEAMASGLPVVTATHVGAAADLVRDGENGRVVAPGDSSALADALAQILGDDALRQRMGAQASHRISSWNVAAAADCFARCAQSVAARQAARV